MPRNSGSSARPHQDASFVFADGTALHLTEQQIHEFQQAFNLFDKDGDGHVTAKELRVVFDTLGQSPTEEELNGMIDEVDKDGNGEMEFPEFCQLMAKRMGAREDEDTVRAAFSILDADGSGHIEREELKKVLQGFSRAGEHIDDDELDALIKECDVDGDGDISFDEFAKVMMFEGGDDNEEDEEEEKAPSAPAPNAKSTSTKGGKK